MKAGNCSSQSSKTGQVVVAHWLGVALGHHRIFPDQGWNSVPALPGGLGSSFFFFFFLTTYSNLGLVRSCFNNLFTYQAELDLLLGVGFPLVAAAGATLYFWCSGFLMWWILLLQSIASRRVGFTSCSTRHSSFACGP